MATAYDYGRLIKALLLPAPLGAETDRRDRMTATSTVFVGELMKREGTERPTDRTAANQHDDRSIADDLLDRETPQAHRGRSDGLT